MDAKGLMENHEFFLKSDLGSLSGKWIAIVDKEIAASGDSISEVVKESEKKYPGKKPLIARAPTSKALIL